MKFYSAKKIKQTNAQYNIVWGEKGTGKSYSVKAEAIADAVKDSTRHKFIVLRRWAQDISTIRDCEDYFIDPNFDVSKITKGKYNRLKVKGSARIIYGANVDENGTLTVGEEIGRFCALSTAEHYASKLRQGYSNIIFEEFQSRGAYLVNEVNALMVFVSTAFGYESGRVWLLGNAVSPICPYYSDWCLSKIVSNQKQGTIESVTHTWMDGLGEKHKTKIAIERTAEMGAKTNMIFGKQSKIVSGGKYESADCQHLPESRHHYRLLYSLVYQYNDHAFLLEYLLSKSGLPLWFVSPKTSDFKGGRIISNLHVDSPLWTQGFTPLTEAERRMFSAINKGRICYANNDTGANFLQCYRQSGRERGLMV